MKLGETKAEILNYELEETVKTLNTVVNLLGHIVNYDDMQEYMTEILHEITVYINFPQALYLHKKIEINDEFFMVLAQHGFNANQTFKIVHREDNSLLWCVYDIGSSLIIKNIHEDVRFKTNEVFEIKDEKTSIIARCLRLGNEVIGVFLFFTQFQELAKLQQALDRINKIASIFAPHLSMKIANIRKNRDFIRKINENKKFTDNIIHSMADALIVLNSNMKIIRINNSTEKLFEYNEKELIGQDIRELFPKSYNNFVEKKGFEKFQEKGFLREIELEVITRSNKKLTLSFSGALLRSESLNPSAIVCILHDISDRKAFELAKEKTHQEQLMQADKMISLGILVSGVAHEINNPNNFIMLNAPLLEEACKDAFPILNQYFEENGDFMLAGLKYSEMKDKIPGLFKGIIEGSDRIKNIVQELKDYVRVKDPKHNEKIDINSVTSFAINLLSNLIKKSTNKFQVKYCENVPTFIGSSHQIEQVIINLIQNACQALTNIDNSITITTRYDLTTKEVIFEIKDEGKGIEKENLKYILDPFFTTRREDGGTGLGLAVSSNIIDQHKGKIEFELGKSKGTTVYLRFPANVESHNLQIERSEQDGR